MKYPISFRLNVVKREILIRARINISPLATLGKDKKETMIHFFFHCTSEMKEDR